MQVAPVSRFRINKKAPMFSKLSRSASDLHISPPEPEFLNTPRIREGNSLLKTLK